MYANGSDDVDRVDVSPDGTELAPGRDILRDVESGQKSADRQGSRPRQQVRPSGPADHGVGEVALVHGGAVRFDPPAVPRNDCIRTTFGGWILEQGNRVQRSTVMG